MSNLSQFAAGGDPQYWVSGTTYALGKTVRSPTDHQRYVRVVAGAGTTDPANDATNWRPDGGRAIKSIQRGVYSGTANSITISAVNPAKSILLTSTSVYDYPGTWMAPSAHLSSSTTITVSLPGSNSMAWQVVEYH